MGGDIRPAWKAVRSEARACLIAAAGLIGTAFALGAASKRVRELEDECASYREDIACGRLAWFRREATAEAEPAQPAEEG